MDNVLVEAIDLLKRLPEKGVEKALKYMKELKKECEKEKKIQCSAMPSMQREKCRTQRAQEGKAGLFVPFL